MNDQSSALLKAIFEWDVANWSTVLTVWERALAENSNKKEAVEIGARNGGVSLFLALRGVHVTCSDLFNPEQKARPLHEQFGVGSAITYAALDATAIALPDASVDIVVFKSVLGGITGNDRVARHRQAITEMHRILRPGGVLLFAENLSATWLHRVLRRAFVPWSRSWHYLTLQDLQAHLDEVFGHTTLRTFGVFGLFGRSQPLQQLLHVFDTIFSPLLPKRWHYIGYGYAVK
jgi:ubiquinone/menaquinone biosynthesis C-methylase UbiE